MSTNLAAKRPSVVIVGGFLGSGKTSLILAAAQLLEQRGLRCAVILNDQGDELVDMRHADAQGVLARAVSGGCFCCRFSGLMEIMDELRTADPDVIFAEPVGSCTDISATVLGPLLEEFDRYRLAPFSVLVDPARSAELLSDAADSDLAFLFRKQLQEADLVCMSKADLYADPAANPGLNSGVSGAEVRHLSAKTGQGVQEWLDEILFGSLEAGATTLEIDYSRYARAEAALAWLNLSFILELVSPLSPALVVGPFIDRLDAALAQAEISIVHLKVFDSSATGWLKAAVCANGEEAKVEGNLDASAVNRHELLVNLRVKGDPVQVQEIVEKQLRQFEGEPLNVRLDCFSPAAPKPERRVPRAKLG
jgi:Ni2+-binding GTPase involved in maturation of urease and hydrogenase